jgi:hypothetical protein
MLFGAASKIHKFLGRISGWMPQPLSLTVICVIVFPLAENNSTPGRGDLKSQLPPGATSLCG